MLQVFDRSDSPERCKVQVLAKALETNDRVTHLNLEMCQIEVEGIKVGSPVWDPVSGVEARSDELKLYLRFFRLFGSTALLFCRSTLSSRFRVTLAV